MGKAFNLKNGTILLVTEAPGGLYNAAQLKKIAAISDNSMAIVKATEDQRLALFVKETDAPKIAEELKSIGLGIRHYQDGLHQPTACIGELCPDHEQDALGSAMTLTKELADVCLKSPLKIGINGCASCCVPCHTLDISVVGDVGGYRIALGGKNSQLPEMASFMADNVPAEKLAPLLKKVVTLYQAHAEEGESLQELMDRLGASEFINALAPYSQDAAAAGGDDPFADSSIAETPAEEDLSLDMDGIEDIGTEDLGVEGIGAEDELDLSAASEDLDLSAEGGDLDLGASVPDIDVTEELSSDTSLNKLEKDWEQNEQELLLDDDLPEIESEEIVLESLNEEDLAFVDEKIAPTPAQASFTAEDQLMEDTDFAGMETEAPLEFSEEEPTVAEELSDISLEEISDETLPQTLSEDELSTDFEAQLEESIAEEETFRAAEAADENSRDRDETLTLLEGGLEELPATSSSELDDDLLREAAEKLVASAASQKQDKAKITAPTSGGLTLSGMHVSEENHLVLEFTNGALMTIAADKIPDGQKTLKFGSQVIQIEVLGEGYQVEADGISLFYPFSQMSVA